MLFQTLDDKTECVGIYTNNQLLFGLDSFPSDLTRTWRYASYLKNMNIEYASLYLEGQPLANVLPEYLKDDWDDVHKKIQAFRRSLATGHVNLRENCFYDLVPQRFLADWCEIKNRITEYIFASVPRPRRYDFSQRLSILLHEIGERPLNIDERTLRSYLQSPKLQQIAQTILDREPYVNYNQFGSRTGRLTTTKESFPILTLPKSLRGVVRPSNDYFVEIDFNGAEVRTLLGLLNKEQPAGDIHDFHLREIFKSIHTRSEAKVAFFAWLYGSQKGIPEERKRLEDFYEKDSLLQSYWKDNTITTPYHRTMHDVSHHHALNYLVQSTAADLTLKQALKLDYLLTNSGSGSHIAFLIHDAIVIDMKKEDEHLIDPLLSLMASTNFGKFEVNVSRGPTLGNLRKMSDD